MAVRVGVVGAGAVGSTLGKQLLKAPGGRFQVKYGSRDPSADKVKEVLAAQPGATADTIPAAVEWADVVILAAGNWDFPDPKPSIQKLVASMGPGAKGKPLIDLINPISPPMALSLAWAGGPSSSEILQAELPDTPVYKAFNTIGVDQMAAPDGSLINGQQLTMLYCGPAEGREAVADVIGGVGFAPKYVGPIRYARNLDAIAELWIHLTVPPVGDNPTEGWGRNFAFQVIEGKK